jgi:hypothetical protein
MYKKSVLYCWGLIYAATTEFAIGMERGIIESELSFGDIIVMCSNVGICYCLLTGVKIHHWKGQILHLTNHVAFLDSGSSTSDLSVACLPSKVPWCSTVLKQ